MTVESAEAGFVEILRATEFPHRWEPISRPLEDVTAYDPTVLRRDDDHWLWVTIGDNGVGSDDELHLFFADSLEGPWEAHPRNPVVSDVRCARPGGLPFAVGSKLVRPAQSVRARVRCRRGPARGRVRSREPTARPASPSSDGPRSSGGVGCHTYNRGERFEAFDWFVAVRPGSSP